jgi:hypothetical protein
VTPAPSGLGPIDPTIYARTHAALHTVAVHVLARARHLVTGRFGLRVRPGGFGTPAFGPDDRVLRISGGAMLDERTGPQGARTRTLSLDGRSLAEVAAFAEIELDPTFRVGHDTPELGHPETVLAVDPAAAAALGAWLAVGAVAVDAAVVSLGEPGRAGVLQLWPEHFDAGLDVAVRGGRANLGMSAGDAFCPEPYAYVGPWAADRPGDPAYWNAPFGAYLPASGVVELRDPTGDLARFLARGLSLLGPPTA